MNPIELPLLPATTFDPILSGGGSKDAVQKLRKELRKELGTNDIGSFWSFGRYGTVNLEPSPLFSCLVTGARWNRERAQYLAQAYNDAGLEKLLHSPIFRKAIKVAGEKLKSVFKVTATAAGGEQTAMVVGVLSDLIANDGDLRSFAQQMTEINRKVDENLPEVRRHSGQLVRIDGNEALVTLEVGDREELRTFHADLFRATGLVGEGSSFVLHEMNWTADLQSRIAIPAVDIDVFDGERERRLSDAETPLPRPEEEVS